MTERLILTPPKIVETQSPVIFLVGPIQGGPGVIIADSLEDMCRNAVDLAKA